MNQQREPLYSLKALTKGHWQTLSENMTIGQANQFKHDLKNSVPRTLLYKRWFGKNHYVVCPMFKGCATYV